jgi:hypothetical protein
VRSHRRDKLAPTEWILIYNDVMHVRFRFMMTLLLATVFSTTIYGLQDYRKHNGKFTNPQLAKLQRDLYEVDSLN